MKQLRVLLLPSGGDGSPSQSYPQQYVAGTHLYTWVERDDVGKGFLSKESTRWQGLGLKTPTFRSKAQRSIRYTTVTSHIWHRSQIAAGGRQTSWVLTFNKHNQGV